MAKSRPSVRKRQRERKKAEKAAMKRAKRLSRKEGDPLDSDESEQDGLGFDLAAAPEGAPGDESPD